MLTHSRPRLRHFRRHNIRNVFADGVAVMALALMATKLCSAFTSSFSPTATLKVQRPFQGLQLEAALPADAHEGTSRPGGGAALPFLGCAGLILAATARKVPNGKAPKPRHAVTACHAAPVTMPELSRPAIQPVSVPELSRPAMQPGSMVQSHGCCQGRPAAGGAAEAAPPPSAAAAPAACLGEAAAPARPAASAGRFVGRARRSRTRRAAGRRSSARDRTARRSLGARLQNVQIITEAPPASFDPSRLETKIQAGLQTSTCIRSARGREVRTPSSSKASSESTGNHFEERSSDSLRRLP